MPGTVASTTHSVPSVTNWATQLDTYLRDARSNDAETRKAAELRLAIFPHAQILIHLPKIWQQEMRRRDCLIRILGVIAVTLGFALIPLNMFLVYLKHQEGFQTFHSTLDMIRLVVMLVSQTGFVAFLSFLAFGNKLVPGAIYSLVQHQCIELVPLLIEALSAPHQTPAGVESRRPQVMAALTRLLPRFAVADRKPLTRRQRGILTRELRQFNRALRNPLAALTPAEADYLTAVLNFLSTEYRREREDRALQPVAEIVEDLAVERTEYHQEPTARTQVREAARAALVRLCAS